MLIVQATAVTILRLLGGLVSQRSVYYSDLAEASDKSASVKMWYSLIRHRAKAVNTCITCFKIKIVTFDRRDK